MRGGKEDDLEGYGAEVGYRAEVRGRPGMAVASSKV